MTGASLAFPEMFLAGTTLLLLLYSAWRGDRAAHPALALAVVALVMTSALVIKNPLSGTAFHGLFIEDSFARFVKTVLLIAAAAALVLAPSYLEKTKIARPEYPVLVLFAALGMMLMVAANDLISLYAGLELQSLPLYVLAAFRRDETRSSEAGLKYAVLGALASAILLYGLSLLYGAAGSTQFPVLATALKDEAARTPGVMIGLVFLSAGFAFKVAAAPFHMWAPDVYEGAPTPVVAFFAAAPKIAAMALLARVLLQPLAGLQHQWQLVIAFVAAASMLLGSLAGLAQTNIKRLMAYSAIGHAGTALVGLAAASEAGVAALLIYFVLYAVGALGAFGVILCLRRQGEMVEGIKDFAGLAKTQPLLAAAMAVFLFSLAGVPPLAGFFGKYVVFLAAVKAGMAPLAILGVITSVIAAAYYLRIVKIMFFDEAALAPLDPMPEWTLRSVTAATALALLLFVLYPSPLMESALVAARSLFSA
jgi:NADH-quinone oxidoreductase subunit N